MAVADELTTILGVDIAKNAMAKLESFKKGLGSVKKTLMGLSVAASGMAATLGLVVKGAAGEAAELEKLSGKTGISTDALQEWGYAANQAGGNAKSFQSDLINLQHKFAGTGKSAEKMLLSLADRMKIMSGGQAQNLGKSWGLSDETIALLKKGRDGIEELRKEAHKLGGIVPEESIKRAAEFKRQMGELQFTFHGISSQVAIAMIPALSRVVDIFKHWVTGNKEWISLGLEALMGGVVDGFERFWKVLKKVWEDAVKPLFDTFEPFTKRIKDNKKAVSDLTSGALLGLLAIFSPLIAKFALISLVILLVSAAFNDLLVYINGGKSGIGMLIEKMKGLYNENKILAKGILYTIGIFTAFKAVIAIEGALSLVKSGLAGITTNFKKLNATMKANIFILLVSLAVAAIQLIYENWGGIAEWFSQKWEAIKKQFPDFGEWAEKAKGAIKEKFQAAVDWIKETFSGLTSWLPSWVKEKIGLEVSGSPGDSQSDSPIPYAGPDRPAQIQAPAARSGGGTVHNDMKTINISVSASDSMQAGQSVAQSLGYGQPPGMPGSWSATR